MGHSEKAAILSVNCLAGKRVSPVQALRCIGTGGTRCPAKFMSAMRAQGEWSLSMNLLASSPAFRRQHLLAAKHIGGGQSHRLKPGLHTTPVMVGQMRIADKRGAILPLSYV